MSEDEKIPFELEARMTEEMKYWWRRFHAAGRSGDELGVVRAMKRYNELQDKVREC